MIAMIYCGIITIIFFSLQNSISSIKKYNRFQPSWKSASQLITLIIPYLPETQNPKDKAIQLDKLIKLLQP